MESLAAVPFIGMLLGIALLPLLVPHIWEHPAAPIALVAVCSAPVVLLVPGPHERELLIHGLEEYVAFMALISALYVTAGGIHLSGNPRGTPLVNVSFLGIGAVAASLIGTTGASMLLIRPLLDANQERRIKTHIVVFFILIVSNSGGLLTPLGDPPLYLGYLHGVPFTFTFHLWPAWLLAAGFLLAAFWLWDRRAYGREAPEDLALDAAHETAVKMDGKVNLLIAAGIITCSALGLPSPWRELGYGVLIGLSLALTPKEVRDANTFHYGPLKEVAILFLGIFITMVPALHSLEQIAPHLPVHHPIGLFFMSGVLSSVLDNAPTYLLFASLAAAHAGHGADLAALATHSPALLAAVSVGSVFMGANTYIGNGPNLLVKAVAEGAGEAKVEMPDFLTYAGWATLVLSPVYLGVVFLMFW
ncbi:MAG TPA: sodium:proton antiporter [Candidatus Binatia bacterium]|nr:sodium:proton antiporter [Candidatus Binatia bacterium]